MRNRWSAENLTFLGALMGLVVGWFFPALVTYSSVFGDLFLLLLKMMIVPLILVSVFLAVARQAELGHLSRLGWRTLFYFLGTSALACLTGLVMAQLLPSAAPAMAGGAEYPAGKLGEISLREVFLGFFAGNPFRALADGEIIQIVIFSILMGAAAMRLTPSKRDLLVAVADAANDLVMIVIRWILWVAPLGVFSLVATVFAKTRAEEFGGLGWFFGAVAAAALTHALFTLPLVGLLAGRFHPYRFLLQVKEALLVALATSSSSATLPVSTRVLEAKAGVRPETAGFVLPLGATLNMDGSALYQTIVVLFLGGMSGLDFSLSQQVLVFILVMLSSAGTAGIPGGGLVMMGAIFTKVGIPLEMLGLYLLVDRFWDPIITAINVMGDLFGAKVIDRWMNEPIANTKEST